MSRTKATTRADARRPGAPEGDRIEWVGGLLRPPFYVMDRPEPYRPVFAVWIEVTASERGPVVGQSYVMPEDESGALASVLVETMQSPLVGPPRRPARIRVSDAALVPELAEVVDRSVPITVAPTPELDELLEFLIECSDADGPDEAEASYLGDGRIPAEVVRRLFAAARVLHHVAPWEVASDDQVLRLDIPAFGVEGACVSVIGALGEVHGLLVFPSYEGYEAFVDEAELERQGAHRVDLGTGLLAVTLERGAEVPPAMRREVAAHDWPIDDPDAYPVVERRDPDGASRPLGERDVRIAAAAATSLATFFLRHRRLFESETFEPVSESFFDADELEVRYTVPYHAFEAFEATEPSAAATAARRPGSGTGRGSGRGADSEPAAAPRFRPRASRNAPCPCGSGKKYKKCHLPIDQAAHEAEHRPPRHLEMERETVDMLLHFASRELGPEWRRFREDFADLEAVMPFAVPWSVYGFQVDGKTVLERFVEARGGRLTADQQAWFEAERAAWLSVWEVTAVEPGRSLGLRDLLSDERRTVEEKTASRSLVVRDAILASVVDFEGTSTLGCMYPAALPPFEAADLVRRARGRLRRKRAVPVERLRDGDIGRYLIRRWEESVTDWLERAATPPELRNSDGDPILLTTDRFEIAPGARAAVAAGLEAMDGVDAMEAGSAAPDPADGDSDREATGGDRDREATGGDRAAAREFVFLKPGPPSVPERGRAVIGNARIEGSVLLVETNSIERADALRARIEGACGSHVQHRGRMHSDPRSPAAREESSRSHGPALESLEAPEARQMLREVKAAHYRTWLDTALPALDGRTPREAARTAAGRRDVDLLLRSMEHREARGVKAPEDRFDFGAFRRQLGIEET